MKSEHTITGWFPWLTHQKPEILTVQQPKVGYLSKWSQNWSLENEFSLDRSTFKYKKSLLLKLFNWKEQIESVSLI